MKEGIVTTTSTTFFNHRPSTSASLILNLLGFVTFANCFQVALGFDITNPLSFIANNVTYTLKTIPELLPSENSIEWQTFTDVANVILNGLTDAVITPNISTTNVLWKLPFCKFKFELASDNEASPMNIFLTNVVNFIKNSPQFITAVEKCAKELSMALKIVFAVAIGLVVLVTIGATFALLKCVRDKYKENNPVEENTPLHRSRDLFAVN